MILLIITSATFIVSFICLILFSIFDWDSNAVGFFGGTTFISTLTLVLMGISLLNIDKRFDKIVYEYNALSAIVESYEPGDYANTEAIIKEVLTCNYTIAKHKAYANNKWTGLWYSEKVGSLEPLTIDFHKR